MGKKLIGLFLLGGVMINSCSIVNAADNSNTPSGFGDATSTATMGVAGSGANTQTGIIDIIRKFVNWGLGMLALISLIVLMYGGFNMVTAAGDEGKYKTGFKILQQAGVGLLLIGMSWFIVSFIFWIVGNFAGGQGK